MNRTEVYSWRLSPHLKMELEEAARAEQKSLAQLLEQISKEWLERSRALGEDEEQRQQRLRSAAQPFVGTLRGGDPDRAGRARAELRRRIARRHAR